MITNYPRKAKDGITPHIGDNGNWFLGTEDTGVVAKAQGNTKIAEVTLLATDWDESLTQTIACEGISANEANQMVTLLPALANKAVYSSCRVTCTAFAENSLTFMAESLPEEDILVYVAMEDEHASVANNVYSLEETVVGTWIDGKPLYKKTFVTTTPSSTTETTVVDLTDFGHDMIFVKESFVCSALTSGTVTPMPIYIASSVYAFTRIWQGNGISCKVSHTDFRSLPLYITVYYTKTTDVATIEIPTAMSLRDAYEEGVNEA